MIGYVTDTGRWDGWMREYLYGALYIFPPDEAIGPIDALRNTYDPRSAATCQAHVSLSEPLPGPLTAEEEMELAAIVGKVDPFVLRYGPVRSFPPYPGVAYSITPEEPFRALRSAIHEASAFDGVALRREKIAPHMTIAEFISVDRTNELVDELGATAPTGEFTCDRVEYAVPDADFVFRRVLALPLRVPTAHDRGQPPSVAAMRALLKGLWEADTWTLRKHRQN
jgi:2'-5' RNA ligase